MSDNKTYSGVCTLVINENKTATVIFSDSYLFVWSSKNKFSFNSISNSISFINNSYDGSQTVIVESAIDLSFSIQILLDKLKCNYNIK